MVVWSICGQVCSRPAKFRQKLLLASPCARYGGVEASKSAPSCSCLNLGMLRMAKSWDEAKQLRGGGRGWPAALLKWPAGSRRDRVSSHLPRPHAAKGACCI